MCGTFFDVQADLMQDPTFLGMVLGVRKGYTEIVYFQKSCHGM
jgi:hypothetical protein